jgi:Predicted P-loop ATPase and inactivated derivatives
LLACSTNASQYLHDDTGNLRFLVWKVTQLDSGALERDREALWAEALASVDSGASWRDGLEDLRQVAEEQANERQVVDPLGEQLISLAMSGVWDRAVTSAELLHMLGIKTDRDESHSIATRLGESVKRIGGTSGRRDVGPAKVRWYAPPAVERR